MCVRSSNIRFVVTTRDGNYVVSWGQSDPLRRDEALDAEPLRDPCLDPLPDRLLSDPLPDLDFLLELALDDALDPDPLDEAREPRDEALDDRLLVCDEALELALELAFEPLPLPLELALEPLLPELAREPFPLLELAREEAREEPREPDLDRDLERSEPDLDFLDPERDRLLDLFDPFDFTEP